MGNIISFIPIATPLVFLYFDLVGGYVPNATVGVVAAVNMFVGAVIGDLAYDFMTSATDQSITHILKSSLYKGVGAFIGVQFILPLTGLGVNGMTEIAAAYAGGYALNWLMQIF